MAYHKDMSAGSAFAAGLRSGQAIYDNAVRNAMARKRFDMAKAEFKYQQAQRKQAIEDEVAATTAFDKLKDYLGTNELDAKSAADREIYNNILMSVEPEIMRHKPTFDQYERYKTVFEQKEHLPQIRDRERKQRTIIENYLDNSSEQEPLYKRDKDNNFILNTEGKPQYDMRGMIQFNLKTEADRQRLLQTSKYGTIDDLVESGEPVASFPPEMRPIIVRERMKIWENAVQAGDVDSVIEASKVFSKSPDGTERQALGKYKFTLSRLGELKDQLEIVGDTGPIVGIFRGANPYDVKAKLLQAQITKIIPGLARGVFGEVGVLTDQDVALYSRTLGTLKSPKEVNDLLTSAAIKMVANSYEDKLRGMAESRVNVSGFLPGLKDLKDTARQILGEEEEAPAASVEVDSLQLTDDGKPVISEELAEQLRATGADTVEVVDQATGIKRKIKINRVQAPAAPTPNPPTDPLDKSFDALFGPGSIDAAQSEATTATRDRKQQIQDRLKLLRERLSELPSPPSIKPSYVPVSPRISKADKDTAAQRRMILKAIEKSEAELKKL